VRSRPDARLPMLGTVFIDVKARFLSSLTWATYQNMQTLQLVSFHPDALCGVVSIGGVSPMISGSLRAYGGMDLLLGCFGLELFTAEKLSVFLDVGGGLKGLLVDAGRKTDPYVVAAGWLGSGFGIKMGMRFYF
jgi:hypothetical protein